MVNRYSEIDVNQIYSSISGSDILPGYKHAKAEHGGGHIKAIFGLLVNDVMSCQSAIAVVLSLLPAVAANFASSLRAGEALIAVTLISLGLWGSLWWTASWIAAALLSW